MKILCSLFILLIVSSIHLFSQQDKIDSLQTYLEFDSSNSFSFLSVYFPPFFIQYSIELKSFIRSNTFKKIRERYGDRKAVDAIYIYAMKKTGNNTAISLLICMTSCFDHRVIGLKVPIFALFFPLSNESEEEFQQRVNNLPKNIFNDSPKGKTGDRDKLQHFFGSAFLTFVFESKNPAEQFSEFVERGEKWMIVDGVMDKRDIAANREGQKFGLALLKNNLLMPSDFLISSSELPFKIKERTGDN